jgi:N-acetylglucosaminyldiphosphoundecaprenol N-acetyl-beta-D-mannosaminyltransferase
LVPALLQQAVKKGHRVFFLGGQHYVTSKAVAVLQAQYPGLNIAGYYSPPFLPLLEMDHEEIAARIRAADADVVLVSFGCPKAEKWMAMHYQALGVPVMIGVGGTIDFLAGEKRRAPRWMQRSGTEWVFRMLQEPHRLASRYAKDFWRFLPAVVRQCWELKRDYVEGPEASRCTVVMREPRWLRLRLPERLDRRAVERHGQMWEVVEEHHCLVELDNVSFIDSTGIAWLLHMRKRLRASGWQLVLLAPNLKIIRALQAQELEKLFLIANDVVQARELIGKAEEAQTLAWDPAKLNGVLSVCCRGEITARNAEEFWKMLQHHISTAKGWRKHVTVDLSEAPFVESSGLRQMLRAKQFAREMKVGLEFTGLQPEVRRALRLAKVDQAFWELNKGG